MKHWGVKVLLLAMAALLFLVLPFLAFSADIAPVLSWTVNVRDYQTHDLTLRRGETVILQPTFLQGTNAMDLSQATAVTLRYRYTAMTGTFFYATGAVYQAAAGSIRIRWTPAQEAAAQIYQYEIAVQSTNATLLRAFGRITLDGGMGTAVEAPPSTFDWGYMPTSQPGVVSGDIAPVLPWTVAVDQYLPRDLTIRRGETVLLQPAFVQGTNAVDLSQATGVVLRYGPRSATNCWALAGYVYDGRSGVARIRWTPAALPSNAVCRYEIAVISDSATLLRAFGNLTIDDGFSKALSGSPAAVTALDWSTLLSLNSGLAPFPTYGAMTNFWLTHSAMATGVLWGSVTGSISNQADLMAALHSIALTPGPPGTNGPPGASGSNGAPGSAATIAISSVVTLDAGASAYVTNMGSSNAASLVFGIPAGRDGTIGRDGSSGANGTSATINVSAVLTLAEGSSAYITNVGTPTAASWIIGIPRGATGTTGASGRDGSNGRDGANGSNGLDGAAATINIASVLTLSEGASAYVTNVGTASAASWIIGIPRGATGATGAPGPAGTAGSAATISVAAVNSLPSGSSAYVTNMGSSTAAALVFGIPAGPAGSNGTAGAQGPTATNGFGFTLIQSTQWLATVTGGTNLTLTVATNATSSGSASVSASSPLTATTNAGVVTVALSAATFQGATWPKALWANSTTGSYYWSDIVPGTNNINIVQMTNKVVYGALSDVASNNPTQNQTWTCPTGVTNVFVQCWGAGGGGANGTGAGTGGAGGYASLVTRLIAGNNYVVRVGRGGPVNSSTANAVSIPAYPGPSGTGRNGSGSTGGASSGGGYTAFLDGTNYLVVAGGGGGAAGAAAGGIGGGSTGGSGNTYNGGTAGTGGSQSAGGTIGGGWLFGGGGTNGASSGNTACSGGGGAGWYGGGGGSNNANSANATGGGGSCYVSNPAWGSSQRGNNTGADDYQSSWGAGGGYTANGSDGAVVIRYGVGQ